MHDDIDPGRRQFCGGLTAGLAGLAGGLPGLLGASTKHWSFPERALVHAENEGAPMRAADLESGRNYIFTYPYVSTPCFLLDLGQPLTDEESLKTREGRPYRWHGGIGPNRSIVAFSAICPHRFTHPAPGLSFISYRPGGGDDTAGAGVIHCCSENSRFDPARGARVLSGPAPEPLAAIALAHDPETDALRATGAYGGLLFDRFMARFQDRLALTHGPDRYAQTVSPNCRVHTLDDYSRSNQQCG